METLHDPKRAENPLEKANFLSKWLFWYMNPLLIHGYKNILDKTSIFKVHRNSSAAFLNTKIESYWRTDQQKYGKPNLMRVIFKMGFRKLAVAGFCFIIEETCRISQALFLKRLLDSLLSDPVDSMKYVYWASCLVAVLFTQVAMHSLSLLTSETVGVNSRSSCLTLLYKKALKLSNAKLSSITTGHVITMFSSDAQKIQEGFKLVNYIWLGPLIMVAAIFLLWNEVGTICLTGVGVLLISLPIQAWVGRFYAKMRLKTVLKTDKRVNIMNEIISSMQVTKMYAWEESFSNLVNKARKLESNAVMKTSLVRALNISIHSGTIYIIFFAVFSMYYFYGDGITLSVVFFVMSIFYSIRLPVLVLFPVAVQVAMECYVSCNRIQEFLLKDEIAAIDADNSQKKENPKYEPMVKFENVVASWDERELQPLLNKVSFLANHKKSLIMVIGPVGSGKSSLLMAAMKELKILSGDMVVNGSIAYVSQESWVFGGTVRQNILFGKDYIEAAYNEVIKACDLQKDVDSFEKGDLTLVGERGVSLSGGQKARINLARAVYHNADIYLLDDPLSAVDAKVGKYLFEKCIKGLLKNKIVILVTHQVQFLKHADDIVCLQKNEKTLHGSLEDLTHCGIDVAAILQPDNTDKQSESCPATDKENDMLGGDNLLIPRPHSGTSTHFSNDNYEDQSTDFKSSLESVERPPLDDREESVAKGSVSFKLYIKYFYSGVGWLSFMFMIFTMLLGQTFTTFTDFWLGKWALSGSQANRTVTSDLVYKDDPDINIYVFAGLVLFTAFSNIFRAMYFFATLVRCSKKLHNNMFKSMLKAPMYFFDTNPVGQILNRFSGDVHLLDNELPWIFYDYAMYAILIMSTVILNCVNVPYLVPVAVVLFILFFVLRNFYIRTSRQIKRLEAISRSPLYTHVSATLNGITTIRAFNMEDKILSEFNACLDYQVGAYLTYLYGTRWFGFRLDFTAFVFQLFSIFAPIITVQFKDIDESLLAVSLTYVLMISGSFQWCIRQSAEVDNLMTSAERVFEYAQIKPEPDDGCNYELEPTWPNSGSITADSASFSYHSSLKNALNKLNFTIRSKEKIGIVGRTGAGKSSLISMLLRLGEMNGTVKIDGYDISKLKLKKLRKSISVIPQDPVLFSGTLRKNLDPFVHNKDGDIWEALEEVQLKETVMKLPNKLLAEITEAGSNLSVGERQLMCLARALLRNNRILLIDEATANVDLKTDSIIQRTIREKFKDCTVLTIAHRLNTIMDSDRVMVIDHGEIVEFDEPCDLLQIPSGYFRKLVNQTGEDEANFLELLAKETKELRKSDSV